MSQEGATSIQDLQKQPHTNGGSQNENGSRAVVQEILQEIESNEQRNVYQNNAQQQYNLDQNIQQQSFAPPNQEEARKMQHEMMMQQQMMQQMQASDQENQNEIGGQIIYPKHKSLTEKLFSQIKSPLIVAAIFLLLSVTPTKQLLQKIPKALSETGDITFLGSAVTAILAGILFFVLNMATKNI